MSLSYVPDGDALGLEVVPPLVHLLQPPLQRSRVLIPVQVGQQLPAVRSQGQEVFALSVDLSLQVLEKERKKKEKLL